MVTDDNAKLVTVAHVRLKGLPDKHATDPPDARRHRRSGSDQVHISPLNTNLLPRATAYRRPKIENLAHSGRYGGHHLRRRAIEIP